MAARTQADRLNGRTQPGTRLTGKCCGALDLRRGGLKITVLLLRFGHERGEARVAEGGDPSVRDRPCGIGDCPPAFRQRRQGRAGGCDRTIADPVGMRAA